MTDLDYLKSKFAIFLNCISDEDFKVIIDTLYFLEHQKKLRNQSTIHLKKNRLI